jgi:hypothetical protein
METAVKPLVLLRCGKRLPTGRCGRSRGWARVYGEAVQFVKVVSSGQRQAVAMNVETDLARQIEEGAGYVPHPWGDHTTISFPCRCGNKPKVSEAQLAKWIATANEKGERVVWI